MRIALHQEIERLGEGEGHHGEGDAVHSQGNRAEHDREYQRDAKRQQQRRDERPRPMGQGDVEDVGSDREVEDGAQRHEAGVAKHHVVAHRDSREHEAQRQHLEGPGRVHDVEGAR